VHNVGTGSGGGGGDSCAGGSELTVVAGSPQLRKKKKRRRDGVSPNQKETIGNRDFRRRQRRYPGGAAPCSWRVGKKKKGRLARHGKHHAKRLKIKGGDAKAGATFGLSKIRREDMRGNRKLQGLIAHLDVGLLKEVLKFAGLDKTAL